MVVWWLLQNLGNIWKSDVEVPPTQNIEVHVRDMSGLTLFEGSVAGLHDLHEIFETKFGIGINMQQFTAGNHVLTELNGLGSGPLDILFVLCVSGSNTGPIPPWLYTPVHNRLVGYWYTPKSIIYIGPDVLTGQLAFNEMLFDDTGSRLHGWLKPKEFTDGHLIWRADTTKIQMGNQVWYGPSFGTMPATECIVDILFSSSHDEDGNDQIQLRKSTNDREIIATHFSPNFDENQSEVVRMRFSGG